ncbi:hypothetical protein AFCDBAGC_4595 [Methylobacterium cerastii]|uniref:DUF4157 domain-containing protein n=2 Tax=Methylobacterium TaxID=407 RepID=A0ABQ4QN72_9HYPH|nr:hypothetical protein [Methylobacterium cerastii]GJD46711.1 hypothetical protein AFCDBAGC_4595 [Methylobacterium cerastii]
MAPAQLASPLWHVVTALALAGTMAVHGGTVDAAPRQVAAATSRSGDGSETYRGYLIEIGPDVPNAELDQLRRAAEHQVDLVEATGLDARTKAFLRRFPVVVQTGANVGGHYSGGDRVTIAVADPNDDRPILLHEYMHIYHFRMLPGGNRNADILTYYGRAREGGFYSAGAYVLKNPGEFFAMTASVYLHGRLAREPFTREELRQKQPVYFGYLHHLFGSPRAVSTEPPQTSGTARP